MIKLDYLIERDESDEVKQYVPDNNLKEIPNISMISGPNSHGKSSLLNIIAVAFGGENSDYISDSLKEKLQTVQSNDRQKFSFDMTVTCGDDTLSFRKSIEDKTIEIERNDNPMSLDSINRKYDVLYDIPQDPVSRLTGLTATIESMQKDNMNRVRHYISILQTMQREIKDSRDDNKINDLSAKIEDDRRNINNYKVKMRPLKERVYGIMQYAYLMEIESKKKECEKLKNEAERVAKKEKRQNKRKTNDYDKKIRKIKSFVDSIDIARDDLVTCLEGFEDEDREGIQLLKDIDFEHCLVLHKVDNNIKQIVKDYYDKYEKKQNELNKRHTEIDTQNLVESILRLLAQVNDDISIPGIEKTVGEVTGLLRTAQKKSVNINQLNDSIEETLRLSQTILDDLKELELNKLPEYIKIVKDNDQEDDDDYSIIELAEEKVAKAKEKYDEIASKAVEYGIYSEMKEKDKETILNFINSQPDAKSIQSSSLSKLISHCIDEEIQIREINNRCSFVEERLNKRINNLEELRQKEVHPFFKYKKEVDCTVSLLTSIMIKLQQHDEFIKGIKHGNIVNSEEFELYNESVSEYLSNLIGNIRHVDTDYETASIDVLNKRVVTKDNKVILFSEMGTGQGQSAYLLGQLANLERNDKQMIVLFDEIETMDNDSLYPIKKKVKELYEAGKVVLAIMVRKGEGQIVVEEMEVDDGKCA